MRKGEQTKRRILERALDLASLEGLPGVTIGALASALEMSKSGLYAHFRSKEQLDVEIVGAMIARFEEGVIAPTYSVARGVPRLQAVFERWLDWGEDPVHPGGCPIIAVMADLDDRPGPAREALFDAQERLHRFLARLIEKAVEERHLAPLTEPRTLALGLHSLILGFHHAARLLGDRQARSRVRSLFERLLAAHGAAWSRDGTIVLFSERAPARSKPVRPTPKPTPKKKRSRSRA